MRYETTTTVCVLVLVGLSSCRSDDDLDDATPVQLVLTVASSSPAVWIDTIGMSSENGRWLAIRRDGESPFLTNASCHCDSCDGFGGCPMYDAPLPNVEELLPERSKTFEWDGLVPGATRQCQGGDMTCYLDAVAPAATYDAWFCWGASVIGTPPHEASLQDERCEGVEFEMPNETGTVEHVIGASD